MILFVIVIIIIIIYTRQHNKTLYNEQLKDCVKHLMLSKTMCHLNWFLHVWITVVPTWTEID